MKTLKKGSRVIMLNPREGDTLEVLTVVKVYYMGRGESKHRRIDAVGDLTGFCYDAIDTSFAPARKLWSK